MTSSELKTLLEEYGSNLSRFCYSLCKNEYDADDLFQETCIKLLNSNFEHRGHKATLSFLYKTCLNAFRNVYRAMRRRGETEISGLAREYLENIPEKAAENDVYDDLYRAIYLLPYKYRVIITMSYMEEMSEKSIAEILGIPQGTVKSRLHKAKQLLKKELQKYEND